MREMRAASRPGFRGSRRFRGFRGWWYRPSGDEFYMPPSAAGSLRSLLSHREGAAVTKGKHGAFPTRRRRGCMVFAAASAIQHFPLNQPALWAEPEPPRAAAQWRLEPGRQRRLNLFAFREYNLSVHYPTSPLSHYPKEVIHEITNRTVADACRNGKSQC